MWDAVVGLFLGAQNPAKSGNMATVVTVDNEWRPIDCNWFECTKAWVFEHPNKTIRFCRRHYEEMRQNGGRVVLKGPLEVKKR